MDTMRAVILAAGDGGRLYPLTSDTPKPLLRLNGRPIINHVLDALYAAGVRDTTVVLGYRGEQIRRALADLHPCGMTIRFAHNGEFDLGNARSLWAAREEGPFVLAMADHLIEPALVRSLVAGANGRCRLAVDRAQPGDPRADEATRAWVSDGRVRDLGKQIAMWNAFDTGVFWCTPHVFDALTPERRDGEMSAVFASLARDGELEAADVTGSLWFDIDTADDLRMAEALVGNGRLP
jgi:1L-myo-inositol 1-phosphate cytidylyltransferase